MGLIVLLAVSVSLDTLGIGVAYAASGIRVPFVTRVVIGCVVGILTMAAVAAGRTLGRVIPDFVLRLTGGVILAILGGRMLWNALGENKTADYDRDHSNTLEPWEGVVLGFVMALDSVCAALGIAGHSLALIFPVMTAVSSSLFFSLGSRLSGNLRKINGFGGVFLILLGVLRFYSG